MSLFVQFANIVHSGFELVKMDEVTLLWIESPIDLTRPNIFFVLCVPILENLGETPDASIQKDYTTMHLKY